MTEDTDTKRYHTAEWILLAIAGTWSAIVLPIGAIVAPLYSGVSVDSKTGTEVTDTASLVDINGWWVLTYAAIPLVITLIVAALLWRRGLERGPGATAWTAVGLLTAFTLLGMMTIGIFILPVTGCLIAACSARQVRASRNTPTARRRTTA
ncbi:MAG: hypothetical protein ACYC1Z_00710 [Georgenia sp.]